MTKPELEKKLAEVTAENEQLKSKIKEMKRTHFTDKQIRAEVVRTYLEYENRCAIVNEWKLKGMPQADVEFQRKLSDRFLQRFYACALLLQNLIYGPQAYGGNEDGLVHRISTELNLRSEDAQVQNAVTRARKAQNQCANWKTAQELGLTDEADRCHACTLPEIYGQASPCFGCEIAAAISKKRKELEEAKKQ